MAITVCAVLVLNDPLAQCITVNSQFIRCLGQVVVMTADDFQNELLLELFDRLIEEDAASNHLVNQGFQFRFHGLFLSIQHHAARRRKSIANDRLPRAT